MDRNDIHENWRTPLGNGIPAADRNELTDIVASGYERQQRTTSGDKHLIAHEIVPPAWEAGYRTGAADGAADTGRLIRQMTDDPYRAAEPVAKALREQAIALEQGLLLGSLGDAINAVRSPSGLPEQLYWSRPGRDPLAGVVMAAQAWQIGNATGAADGAVMASRQFRSIRPDALLDGLPLDIWLDLAMTPVHERYAAHHGVPSGVQMAGLPTRIAMGAGVSAADAIAGQARQLSGASPARSPTPLGPLPAQVVRAAFLDSPLSPTRPGGIGGPAPLQKADAPQDSNATTRPGPTRRR